MIYVLIVLAGICSFQGYVIWGMHRELKERSVSVDYLSKKAAEISASTHISYDAAMQSLVSLTYTIPGKLRK